MTLSALVAVFVMVVVTVWQVAALRRQMDHINAELWKHREVVRALAERYIGPPAPLRVVAAPKPQLSSAELEERWFTDPTGKTIEEFLEGSGR